MYIVELYLVLKKNGTEEIYIEWGKLFLEIKIFMFFFLLGF